MFLLLYIKNLLQKTLAKEEGTFPKFRVRTENCIFIDRPIELYKNNGKTPCFWRGKKEFQMEEILEILQLNVDSNRICTEQPLSVNEDVAFVIDTWELVARRDYAI